MKKTFGLGAILSITTGKLLCDIGGVYQILNYMTQDKLYTHQLPRATKECAPWLLRQHPQLANLDASGVDRDSWVGWLSGQTAKFGESLSVEPIPKDDHDEIEPLQELIDMVGPDKVIVLEQ